MDATTPSGNSGPGRSRDANPNEPEQLGIDDIAKYYANHRNDRRANQGNIEKTEEAPPETHRAPAAGQAAVGAALQAAVGAALATPTAQAPAEEQPTGPVDVRQALDRSQRFEEIYAQQYQRSFAVVRELVRSVGAIAAANARLEKENNDLRARLAHIQRHTMLD
jgi:hypothetical protein